jgi:broad specificity phosphatase PhoE
MYLMPTVPRNPLPWQILAEADAVPFLLIRHGQTAWNKERRFLGRSNVELDAEGRHQATLVGAALADVPLARVCSSPLARARGTADEICSERNLSPQIVNGLQELDQGNLEGRQGSWAFENHPSFIQAWAKDPTDVRVPGGETMGECQVRCVSALEGILQAQHPGPPVAVVTHRMVLSCLICHALELPLRMWRLIGQRNTAINLLAWREGKLTVHRLNDTDHLGQIERAPPMPA